MALTAFWIADRPDRLASPWPQEKTAQMLIDKHQMRLLKAFGLWPFGNMPRNQSGKTSGLCRSGSSKARRTWYECMRWLQRVAAPQLINRAMENAAAAANPPTSTVCIPPRNGFTPV